MKRRTRKQWYQYHLNKAREEQCSGVRSQFEDEIKAVDGARHEVSCRLVDARASESWRSLFLSWFGIDSEYRRLNIRPLEADLRVAQRASTDVRMRRSEALQEASQQGEAN